MQSIPMIGLDPQRPARAGVGRRQGPPRSSKPSSACSSSRRPTQAQTRIEPCESGASPASVATPASQPRSRRVRAEFTAGRRRRSRGGRSSGSGRRRRCTAPRSSCRRRRRSRRGGSATRRTRGRRAASWLDVDVRERLVLGFGVVRERHPGRGPGVHREPGAVEHVGPGSGVHVRLAELRLARCRPRPAPASSARATCRGRAARRGDRSARRAAAELDATPLPGPAGRACGAAACCRAAAPSTARAAASCSRCLLGLDLVDERLDVALHLREQRLLLLRSPRVISRARGVELVALLRRGGAGLLE